MFEEELSSVFATNNDDVSLHQSLYTRISQHLRALNDKFERLFLDRNRDNLDLVRNPFRLPTEKFQMNF